MAVLNKSLGVKPSLAFRREVELIRITAMRVLKVRYRGTALGVLWSFGNPIMMTLLYTAIFGTTFASYYGSRNLYLLSAFVGVVILTYFLQATGEALSTVVGNGSLLNKIAIPREIFPIASVAANTFQQGVTTFPVLLLLTLVVTRDPLHVVLVPVVLAAIVALSLGFALALAALYVFFRDLPHLWQIVGFVLWLTSPVFYPAAMVPQSVRAWLSINPVGQAMSTLRDLVVVRGPVHWLAVGESLVIGAVVLLLGAALFRTTRSEFMDLL
ncbi:MAG: ABC transporter permease [Candidatus Elarobacter sp.]